LQLKRIEKNGERFGEWNLETVPNTIKTLILALGANPSGITSK